MLVQHFSIYKKKIMHNFVYKLLTKRFLYRSTTLEDIYRHYDNVNNHNRIDDHTDADKDDGANEDYDGHITGYAFQHQNQQQPPQAPKVGHSGGGSTIFISGGGGGYPYGQSQHGSHGPSPSAGYGHSSFGGVGHGPSGGRELFPAIIFIFVKYFLNFLYDRSRRFWWTAFNSRA